ncbi:MAG: hypothetical protein WBX25_34825 [Rhodomicrobium sp.]
MPNPVEDPAFNEHTSVFLPNGEMNMKGYIRLLSPEGLAKLTEKINSHFEGMAVNEALARHLLPQTRMMVSATPSDPWQRTVEKMGV